MRIFLYVSDYPISDVVGRQNGVTRAVHGFAAGLVECGAEVIVLSEGLLSAHYLKDPGYSHYCFRRSRTRISRMSGRLTSPGLLYFLEQTLTPQDILILNGGFNRYVAALARHLQRDRIPYIMAPHLVYDAAMFRKRPYLKYPFWYLQELPLLRQAKAVQVLDPRQAEELQRRGIDRPIITVANGITVDRGQSIAVPRIGDAPKIGDERSTSIFFLGRLSIQTKGLDLLLDAFANLRFEAGMQAQLVLQGDDVGDQKQLHQQIEQLNLRDRVQLQPADYKTNPVELMAAHDIVCLPSRSEGFGLVALEAMLAGRVLLVSENAGIAPHVTAAGCGIVVQPEPRSIQTGLQWLLAQRAHWPEMGRRGRDYALAHLQWPTIAQQALHDYQALERGRSNSLQSAEVLLTR
jgi:glycosyltransferase involved in cell wall biosynthesis